MKKSKRVMVQSDETVLEDVIEAEEETGEEGENNVLELVIVDNSVTEEPVLYPVEFLSKVRFGVRVNGKLKIYYKTPKLQDVKLGDMIDIKGLL